MKVLAVAVVLVATGVAALPARSDPQAVVSEPVSISAPFAAALAPLAGGGLRYGERLTGVVREVDPGGNVLPGRLAEVAVSTDGQRGLLGLAVDGGDRTFATWTRPDGRIVVGQVAPGAIRLVWLGPRSSRLANGGHLALDPTGSLVVSIGDLQEHRLVADPATPNGKLLRLDPDGDADQSPVTVSSGWNNPFAFTFAPSGALWVADNVGRKGRERLARGDRDGRPTSVTELRGTRAPSGLAAIDDDHLALCGFVSGTLEVFDVTRPGRARTERGAVARRCGIGAIRLADGRVAFADGSTIRIASIRVG